MKCNAVEWEEFKQSEVEQSGAKWRGVEGSEI